jgi:hypothetical protein
VIQGVAAPLDQALAPVTHAVPRVIAPITETVAPVADALMPVALAVPGAVLGSAAPVTRAPAPIVQTAPVAQAAAPATSGTSAPATVQTVAPVTAIVSSGAEPVALSSHIPAPLTSAPSAAWGGAAPVPLALPPRTHVPPWAGSTTQLPATIATPYPSRAGMPPDGVAAGGIGLQGPTSASPTPGSSAPNPGGGSVLSGVDFGAGGGPGFFFSSVAALLALAALFMPRVVWTLRTFAQACRPQPFLLLPERPG